MSSFQGQQDIISMDSRAVNQTKANKTEGKFNLYVDIQIRRGKEQHVFANVTMQQKIANSSAWLYCSNGLDGICCVTAADVSLVGGATDEKEKALFELSYCCFHHVRKHVLGLDIVKPVSHVSSPRQWFVSDNTPVIGRESLQREQKERRVLRSPSEGRVDNKLWVKPGNNLYLFPEGCCCII